MNPVRPHVLCAALLAALGAAPALAGSLATSSAAGGSSASVAASSASESSEASSDSSNRVVANLEGPYRVVDVTPLPERPGTVRLTLRPLAGQAEADVHLHVPQRALERGGPAPGGALNASRRPYGVELAHADTREPFLLVIDDDWQRELRSVPVAL